MRRVTEIGFIRILSFKTLDGIANSVYPDQTAPCEQSDLGLYCLPKLLWFLNCLFEFNINNYSD